MKNRYILLVLSVVVGLALTWGVLGVSAAQTRNPEIINHSTPQTVRPNDMNLGVNRTAGALPSVSQPGADILNQIPTEDLVIQVLTVDGLPAVNASVTGGTLSGLPSDGGFTDSNGYVTLHLPSGNYTIIAYSVTDGFYLNKYPVACPGTATISAVGTPEVTLTATKIDGSPMDQAEVNINIPGGFANLWMVAYLGYVDPAGQMVFHVFPGTYDVEVTDAVNYYALYQEHLALTAPEEQVDFNLSSRPWAELAVSHPNFDLEYINICMLTNLRCLYISTMAENARVVLYPDIGYRPTQQITREDNSGAIWHYEFDMDSYYTYFNPYEVITFTVGGELSVTGRTQDAFVGQYFTATTVPADSYGGLLTSIYTTTLSNPDATWSDPAVTLTDPLGHAYTYANWWVFLPTTAMLGIYDMHFEWSTGPYQGVITADSQFRVLPQQTSAVIPVDGGTLYSSWDDTLFEFAPGTFSEPVVVTETVHYLDIPSPFPWVGIGHFYDLEAKYVSSGLPAQPILPYNVTIGYSQYKLGPAMESTLALFNWNGAEWVVEPTSQVDTGLNHVVATPGHFSTWGVLGETNRVFLSIASK